MTKELLSGAKGGGGGSSNSATDTLKANSVYRGVYLISEGPIEGFFNGGKDIYLNDVPLLDSNGNSNFEGVNWTYRDGSPDQAHISGFDSAYSPVSVDQEVTFSNPIEVTVAGNYDAVAVTVGLPSLYRVSDSGETKGEDVSYAIEVKANGSSSWITTYTENFHYQKVTTEYEKTYRVDLPDGGAPWTVRVRRITPDTTNDHIFNKTFFNRYDTIIDGKYSYPNCALLAIEVNARQFGNQIPKVSGKPKGLKVWVPKNYNPATRAYATSGAGTTGGIWDGTFKAAYTDNPVWCYFDLVTNNRYGVGQSLNPNNDLTTILADKWNLYTISQYCDELVSDGKGGTEPRFTFNVKIDSKDSAYNVLRDVASVFRGMLYWSANQIFTSADIPYSPEITFTQSDVENGLFNYTGTPLKTRSTCVLVRWKNPANLYRDEVEIVEDYEAIYQLGYREKSLGGYGITSRGQARRLAKWLLLTEKMQTQTVNFTTGWKGGTLFPGMIVNIADPYKAGLRAGGRILGTTNVGSNVDLQLDASFELQTGTTYYVTVVLPDGSTRMDTIVSSPGTTSTVRITGLYSTPPVNGAVYVITSDDLGLQQYRIVNVKESDHKFEVLAVQHYPNKYAEIEEGPTFNVPPTTLISSEQLPAPTNVVVTQWYSPNQGAEVRPRITVSWMKPVDNRINKFELQIKTSVSAWTTVYNADGVSWDSEELQVSSGTAYQARVRSIGLLGNMSPWTYSSGFDVTGKGTIPPAPTNYSATGIIKGIAVNWDNPSIATVTDFKHVQVWASDTNNIATATLVAEISDDFYILNDVTVGARVYFWLKTVTYASYNNISAATPSFSAVSQPVNSADLGAGAVTITKIASGLALPEIFSSLPVVGNYQGRLVFLTTDNKLYRYTGSAWSAAVPTVDLVGYVPKVNFDPNLTPPEVVSTLPTTGNFQGKTVFLTTDNKLYRYNGTSYIASVAANDLTGQIVDTQITNGAITTAKLAAGAVTANEIAAGTITAAKIAANTITASQIAANTITASQIAANTITASQIAANTITASQLAANSVTAGKIATDAVTAGTIAAAAIGAREIAADAITAAKILAGEVTTSKLTVGGVTTDRLGGNAVTNSALSSGGTVGLSSSETSCCSMSYSSSGGSLDITYQSAVQGLGSNGNIGLVMRLYVDGGLLSEVPFLCPAGFTDIRSVAATWTPGSGTRTLELRLYYSGLSGSATGANAINSQILIVERKR